MMLNGRQKGPRGPIVPSCQKETPTQCRKVNSSPSALRCFLSRGQGRSRLRRAAFARHGEHNSPRRDRVRCQLNVQEAWFSSIICFINQPVFGNQVRLGRRKWCEFDALCLSQLGTAVIGTSTANALHRNDHAGAGIPRGAPSTFLYLQRGVIYHRCRLKLASDGLIVSDDILDSR